MELRYAFWFPLMSCDEDHRCQNGPDANNCHLLVPKIVRSVLLTTLLRRLAFRGLSGAGFSLRVLVHTKTNTHRLKNLCGNSILNRPAAEATLISRTLRHGLKACPARI